MTVLVIAEHDHNSINVATLNCVMAAAQITMFSDKEVHIMVLGLYAHQAALAAAHIPGITKVIHGDGEQFAHPLAENMVDQILSVSSRYSHILFPATASGKHMAPRVAARLGVGQISDMTKVINADTFEHLIYAGNTMTTVQITDAIKVLTVRTTRFDAVPATGGSAEIVRVDAIAPLFSEADDGLAADLFAAVPELVAAL